MSIGTLGDGEDRRTQIIARLGEIHREMGERVAEIEALERELEAQAAGEESPEQRRRGFILYRGGLSAVAAIIAALRATPARATRHARTLAAATAGFAGGAVLTAATVGAGAPAPHTAPPPLPLPSPSATLNPHTPPLRPSPRRSLPPTIIVPARRRSPSASPVPAAPAGPPPPGPSTAPSALPPPPATLSSPATSASPTCVVMVEVDRIITVCL